MSDQAKATLDYEARSACDIKACGSWKYSLDATTQVLCAAFRLPHWEKGHAAVWHPAFDYLGIEESGTEDLVELWDWVDSGGLVESHNAFFEVGVWKNICTPRLGWPEVSSRQFRCSAAKAAAHALPRNLEDAGAALRLNITKDAELAKQVKKMWSPRKPLKAERTAWARQHAPCSSCGAAGKVRGINPATGRSKMNPCADCGGAGYHKTAAIPGMPLLWHESADLFQQLFDYCKQDVLAEEAVSEALPDLSPDETEIFLLDMAINERGFYLDTEAVDTALTLLDGEFTDLNRELFELTGGRVERATQRARMKEWFAENGLELDDTQADTLNSALERKDLSTPVRRGLEIMRALGRSSTSKFEAMRDWVCPDSRVHGGLLYHGASTGRWAGKGIQPHNFPRLVLLDQEVKDEKGNLQPMDPELTWALLKTRDRDTIVGEFGSVMEALSGGLRSAITAAPGKQLYVADYSAIECRVLFWAANDEAGLRIFREGRDPYNEMATTIYGYPVNRKLPEHKDQGQIGKVAILGLGYQMGAPKFADTVFNWTGITIKEDIFCASCNDGFKQHQRFDNECHRWSPIGDPETMTAVKVVDAYREKFWRVKQMWRDVEETAIWAVQNPGKVVPCGKVSWERSVEHDFLYCTLPSGRRLAYAEPEIRDNYTSWGELRPQLSFMGVDPKIKQWRRQTTYGGMITENLVQSISRDLMAEAMLRIEQSGVYTPVLSVHDELVAEADEGVGSVGEFNALMSELPEWAEGCPVTATGWTGRRYKKD